MKQPSTLELLRAVQIALNTVPNTRLNGVPGIRNTYELAALVDRAVTEGEENKRDDDTR